MKLSKQDFRWAVTQDLLSAAQANALWQALESRYSGRPRFDWVHVVYYSGTLIVIGAMGWFMTVAWKRLGGGGIFAISVLYALGFVLAGRTLWYTPPFKVPGGLLLIIAVCMISLALYGLERLIDLWPQGDPEAYRGYHLWVKGNWLFIEVGTIVAALITLKYIRFPFLTAPIALSLWYMSMDLTPLLFGKSEFLWGERLEVSLWLGFFVYRLENGE